jgi:integrase
LYNHQQRERLGAEYHNQGLVCCKDNGDFVNPQTLYHAFKRALKACGLPDIRFHDLRHSYAILCIDVNVPIKVLSQALGHSSTAVTDGVYADSISAKRELANLISKAINE